MALDVLAHVVEFLFGPLFLLVHLTEFGSVLGEVGLFVELLTTGQVGSVIEAILAGEFAVATRTLAATAGTFLWIAVVAAVLGQFGEVGEFGEMGEMFELLD